MTEGAEIQEKRSHKRLDPDIKALRAIARAIDDLPDDASRKRVIEWTVARALGKSWFSLDRFRWASGADHAE